MFAEVPVPPGPPSPCIKVCVLDPAGFCVGCLRTGEEIGRWMAMSPEEQWRLLELLEERRRRAPPPPGEAGSGG